MFSGLSRLRAETRVSFGRPETLLASPVPAQMAPLVSTELLQIRLANAGRAPRSGRCEPLASRMGAQRQPSAGHVHTPPEAIALDLDARCQPSAGALRDGAQGAVRGGGAQTDSVSPTRGSGLNSGPEYAGYGGEPGEQRGDLGGDLRGDDPRIGG